MYFLGKVINSVGKDGSGALIDWETFIERNSLVLGFHLEINMWTGKWRVDSDPD